MTEPILSQDSHQLIPLTRSGYDRLKSELEHLTAVKRPDIADRIRESQQHGEFSEDNSELDEVKFEQAIVETRIAELKAIFSNASVIEEDEISTDYVGIASLVSVKDPEDGDSFELRVVSSVEADPRKGHISNESPLGMAILGATIGQVVSFITPDGPKQYQVTSISA